MHLKTRVHLIQIIRLEMLLNKICGINNARYGRSLVAFLWFNLFFLRNYTGVRQTALASKEITQVFDRQR